jgi:hypothetical protein
MTLTRKSLVAAAALLAVFSSAARALADVTPEQCVATDTEAQTLRRDGKLTDAREKLRACVVTACPQLVRDDCTERLDEVGRAMPSIVFDVKDASGADTIDVKVTVDGRPLAEKLDGTALDVDPGQRTFTFDAQGTRVTKTLVMKEGEKARRERIDLPAPTSSPVTSVVVPLPARSETTAPVANDTTPSRGMPTQKIVGIVVGGVGVAALAGGAIFGLLASSSFKSQQSDCASSTSCANHAQALSDHDSTVTYGTLSTIGFITGGALLAGGAALFFMAKDGGAPATSSALLVSPALGSHEATLSVSGRF